MEPQEFTNNLEIIAGIMEEDGIIPPRKKNPGKAYREKHGYSRKMGELLRKYSMSLEQYRLKRAQMKKEHVKAKRLKHQMKKAQRGIKRAK